MARIAKVTVSETEGFVRWDFSDGKAVEVHIDDLPDEMVRFAALHGLKQKGSDGYAGAKENGWSIAECREITEEILDNVRNGNWNRRATGTGGITVEALVNLTGTTREALMAKLEGEVLAEGEEVSREVYEERKKAVLASLAKEPAVKAEVARIKAERAAEAAKGKTFSLDGLTEASDDVAE